MPFPPSVVGSRGIHKGHFEKGTSEHGRHVSQHHRRGKRYSNEYRLVREWDLDGLTEQQKDAIDPGIKSYFWTPIPIGMMMTSYLAEVLSFVTGIDTDRVMKSFKILDGTAGAGGTTIALGHSFSHVTAGDFCPSQLECLRKNVVDVMGLGGNVQVDERAVNVLCRGDLNNFDAMLLEPCWGGIEYKKVPEGCLDLYLQQTPYDEKVYQNTCKVKAKANLESGKLGKFAPIDTQHFIELSQAVVDIMTKNKKLKVLAVLLPTNFNIEQFKDIVRKSGELDMVFLDPHKVHPPDIDPSVFGDHKGMLDSRYIDKIQESHAYPRYRGPDMFAFVFRLKGWLRALNYHTQKDNTGDMNEVRKRWNLLWRCTLKNIWTKILQKKLQNSHGKRKAIYIGKGKPPLDATSLPSIKSASVFTCLACRLPIEESFHEKAPSVKFDLLHGSSVVSTSCQTDWDDREYWEKKVARENGLEYDAFGARDDREYEWDDDPLSEDERRELEELLADYEHGQMDSEGAGGDRRRMRELLKKEERRMKDMERMRNDQYEEEEESGGGGSGGGGGANKNRNKPAPPSGNVKSILSKTSQRAMTRYKDNSRKGTQQCQLFVQGRTKKWAFSPRPVGLVEELKAVTYIEPQPGEIIHKPFKDGVIVHADVQKTYKFSGMHSVDHRGYRYFRGVAEEEVSDENEFVYDKNNHLIAVRLRDEKYFVYTKQGMYSFQAFMPGAMDLEFHRSDEYLPDTFAHIKKEPPILYMKNDEEVNKIKKMHYPCLQSYKLTGHYNRSPLVDSKDGENMKYIEYITAYDKGYNRKMQVNDDVDRVGMDFIELAIQRNGEKGCIIIAIRRPEWGLFNIHQSFVESMAVSSSDSRKNANETFKVSSDFSEFKGGTHTFVFRGISYGRIANDDAAHRLVGVLAKGSDGLVYTVDRYCAKGRHYINEEGILIPGQKDMDRDYGLEITNLTYVCATHREGDYLKLAEFVYNARAALVAERLWDANDFTLMVSDPKPMLQDSGVSDADRRSVRKRDMYDVMYEAYRDVVKFSNFYRNIPFVVELPDKEYNSSSLRFEERAKGNLQVACWKSDQRESTIRANSFIWEGFVAMDQSLNSYVLMENRGGEELEIVFDHAKRLSAIRKTSGDGRGGIMKKKIRFHPINFVNFDVKRFDDKTITIDMNSMEKDSSFGRRFPKEMKLETFSISSRSFRMFPPSTHRHPSGTDGVQIHGINYFVMPSGKTDVKQSDSHLFSGVKSNGDNIALHHNLHHLQGVSVTASDGREFVFSGMYAQDKEYYVYLLASRSVDDVEADTAEFVYDKNGGLVAERLQGQENFFLQNFTIPNVDMFYEFGRRVDGREVPYSYVAPADIDPWLDYPFMSRIYDLCFQYWTDSSSSWKKFEWAGLFAVDKQFRTYFLMECESAQHPDEYVELVFGFGDELIAFKPQYSSRFYWINYAPWIQRGDEGQLYMKLDHNPRLIEDNVDTREDEHPQQGTLSKYNEGPLYSLSSSMHRVTSRKAKSASIRMIGSDPERLLQTMEQARMQRKDELGTVVF